MLFGLTNAVLALQQVMKQFIKCHNLKYVTAYLESITVEGIDQKFHDENLKSIEGSGKKKITSRSIKKNASIIALKSNFWVI